MKSKLIKGLSIFLGGILMFTACEDEDTSPNLGDAVGTWKLVGLDGTYDRKIINKTGVANTAEEYPLVANWKDAAAFGTALQQAGVAITPEYVVAATARKLTTFKPSIKSFNLVFNHNFCLGKPKLSLYKLIKTN